MTPARQVVLTGMFTTALLALFVFVAYTVWRDRTVARTPWLSSII